MSGWDTGRRLLSLTTGAPCVPATALWTLNHARQSDRSRMLAGVNYSMCLNPRQQWIPRVIHAATDEYLWGRVWHSCPSIERRGRHAEMLGRLLGREQYDVLIGRYILGFFGRFHGLHPLPVAAPLSDDLGEKVSDVAIRIRPVAMEAVH